MLQQVTVRVPASTSNLGPGFDCLGAALRIYDEITIARGLVDRQSPARIVSQAARLFFKGTQRREFHFACSIRGEIPHSRGLGASAAIRLGVLHGLNEIEGAPLDLLSIFRLCAKLEGHPDNAAPASFGGFNVARGQDVQPFKVSPRLHFVLLIPEFAIKTASARKILPRNVLRTNAVENCGNACAITAAFASRNYENLRGAFVDYLHQPFRRKSVPFLPRVIAAAENAGALGAFLSGSGSTICAITIEDRDKIAAAMQHAARPTSTQILITTADNRGVQIGNRKSAIGN